MTRIGNIPAKRSIQEHLPSAPAEVATPKKKAGNSSARMLTERKANGEVSRGKPARPSQSELFTEIHSFPEAQSAKRCVRLTHVSAACSACGRYGDVAHLLGDKRARCGHCCPVCRLR